MKAGAAPATKVSWTDRNVANDIKDHLQKLVPELFNNTVEGREDSSFLKAAVWVTGSNVWRFVYGDVPDPSSDIDIIVAIKGRPVYSPSHHQWFKEHDEARDHLVKQLGLIQVASTSPSGVAEEKKGAKYIDVKGRTFDIWYAHTVQDALADYPEHSHAQARVAYSPAENLLVMLPNSKAV